MFNLRDLGHLLVPFLDPESRLHFRLACREGRVITDRAITTLSASGRKQSAAPQPAAQFIAFVGSVLSRGSRPDKLVLQPYFPTTAAFEVLAAFAQQQQALPQHQQLGPALSFLRHLSLGDLTYTDALAAAVHSAAPNLASLDVATTLSYHDDPEAATHGLCSLITTCAPSLTSLTFSQSQEAIPQPLADSIAACTRLQHVHLELYTDDEVPENDTFVWDSLFRVAVVVADLSSLRSLDLKMVLDLEMIPPSQTLEERLDPITRATQLTSLTLGSPISTTHLTHTLRPLRSLVRLSLQGPTLQQADMRVLAAEYGQLTYFEFGCQSLSNGVDLSPLDGAQCCVPLPAALRELRFGFGSVVAPRDLLALQLPPSLTRLSVVSLECCAVAYEDHESSDDVEDLDGPSDGEGALGMDALGGGSSSGSDVSEEPGGEARAEDAHAAVGEGALPTAPPSPCPGFDRLLEAVALLQERSGGGCEELMLWHGCWEPSPLAWPAAGDGHVRLFAALRPLGLRNLRLWDCVLELGDVVALTEQLPELEVLYLKCQLHPAVVPLLARLPRLRHLTIRPPRGHGTDAWSSSGTAVAAALMPVVLLGAPCLQHLELWARSDDGRELVAALREGAEWVQGQLRRMGRDPGVVILNLNLPF